MNSFEERIREKNEKILRYVLRHGPGTANITLDELGWADIDQLLSNLRSKNPAFTRDYLNKIIEGCGLYMISLDNKKIRAISGHSVKLNIPLTQAIPPDIVYHVSARKNLASISTEGIRSVKIERVQILSSREAALERLEKNPTFYGYGIDAKRMVENGYVFYTDEFGAWSSESPIPFEYIVEYLIN